MRAWQLAACAAAMILTHVASASAEARPPAGPDDARAARDALVEPGAEIDAEYNPLAPARTAASNEWKLKLRRFGTIADNHSLPDEQGLHLSAGFRNLARKGRGSFNPFHAAMPGSLIYTPAAVNALPIAAGIKRKSPAVAMGWNHAVDGHAMIGFEAGTTMDRGDGRRIGVAAAPRWARVDPVVQASFALRF